MKSNKLWSVLVTTASIIFIVGFVLGLTLGSQHATFELSGTALNPIVEESFNTSVMFLVWGVSSFMGMVLVSLAEIAAILQKAHNYSPLGEIFTGDAAEAETAND